MSALELVLAPQSSITGDKVLCDRDGCDWSLDFGSEVDEDTARARVLDLGGSVKRGSQRDRHYCPKHNEDR